MLTMVATCTPISNSNLLADRPVATGYHTYMNVKEIRLANLRVAIAEVGSIAEVARRSDVSEKNLSQILNGFLNSAGNRRSIGDKLAAKLEIGLKRPPGWMDRLHTGDTEALDERFLRADAATRALVAIALSEPGSPMPSGLPESFRTLVNSVREMLEQHIVRGYAETEDFAGKPPSAARHPRLDKIKGE